MLFANAVIILISKQLNFKWYTYIFIPTFYSKKIINSIINCCVSSSAVHCRYKVEIVWKRLDSEITFHIDRKLATIQNSLIGIT